MSATPLRLIFKKVPVAHSEVSQKHGRRVKGQLKTNFSIQINDC